MYTILTYCVTLFLCLVSPSVAQAPWPLNMLDAPVVNTTLGKVVGSVDISRELRRYYQYLGIPYAKPPVGNLRFEPPVPFERWEGVREAYTWGSPCLQFDATLRGRVMGKEDCLFLNVFTPNVSPKSKYPVVVWIHGGGFVSGSADMYDPKYFMDHDVVVVSMNYRLASLGFLNTGDYIVRGNMGLKDQNLALRFVQDNIHNFGGDPNRVTLLGESAGAASVHYHVISPLSKGLFHRAIMQSGNIFCPWARTRSPRKQANRFAKALGCPSDNTTVLVNCLRNMDGKTIVKQHAALLSPVHTQDDFFAGSVEAVTEDDTFLSDNPIMMVKRGDFNQVPVILGMNSAEGGLKTARIEATPEVLNTLDSRWDEHVPILLHYNPALKNVSDKIRRHYCPRSVPDSGRTARSAENPEGAIIPPQESLEQVTKMISDGVWFQATKEAATHHAKYAPVYLNYFSYRSSIIPSSYNMIKSAKVRNDVPAEVTWPRHMAGAFINQQFFPHQDPRRFGACHGDDLVYYMSSNPVFRIYPIHQDFGFSKNVVNVLVEFASERPVMAFGRSIWDPVKHVNRLRYMKLDRNPEMIDQPSQEGIAFIESLNIRNPMDPNNW